MDRAGYPHWGMCGEKITLLGALVNSPNLALRIAKIPRYVSHNETKEYGETIADRMETKETITDEDMIVCPNCMTQNSTMTEFCKSCGYPIGQYVNVDPINRILSQGWLYRKVVSGRISTLGFWGMWILFGSGFVSMLIYMLQIGIDNDGGINLGLWATGLYLLMFGAFLYRITQNRLRIKMKAAATEAKSMKTPGDEWICTECNANVEENATICPNCGEDVSEIEED